MVFASPPCNHFSRAKTKGARDIDGADRLVQKTLEIIGYLKPERWYLENPRTGMLKDRPYMEGIPYVDVDYCQFADWGYQKPTRIWGSDHVKALEARLCDPATCTNVRDRENGHRGHREILGGNHMRYSTRMKYRIPEGVIRYLCGFPDPDLVAAIRDDLSRMRLSVFDTVRFEHEVDERFSDDMASLMARMEGGQGGHNFVSSAVLVAGGLEGEEVEKKRAKIFRDYANTVFTTVMPKVRPVRGPFGRLIFS